MKKTYKCKKCGKIYTSDIGVCPECSTPAKKGGGKIAFLIILLIFIIAVSAVLVGAILTDSPESDSGISSNTSQNLTIGDTLSAKGLNITLQKVEDWDSENMFIKPKEGNKFIRAYFVLENTNSSSRYLGSYDFTCYADNAKADMSLIGEDIMALGDNISGGRTLQGYIYYEVPINAESIEIEYSTDWWGNGKAIFKVK